MDFIDQYLDGLCRTCLIEVEESSYGNNTRTQWQSILDRIEECDTLRIVELLSTAVPQIQIQPSDEMPKKICYDCLQQLLSTYRFQQMCVQSDKQMLELISTKHTDFKISIIEAFKEHELEPNGTDSKTETAHANRIEKPQITEDDAVQSNSLENINKKLESCNNMEGRLNEFIKKEPVTDEDDTMQSTFTIECKEEEEMNGSKDEVIDTEAAQSSAANQLESIDQLPQYCNDSQSELTELIKNEPIEDDESNIVYSGDETIQSTISMIKDEGLPIEFEERQVISPQHYHEKKDNSDMCVKRYNTRSNSTRHLRIKHSMKEITTTAIVKKHTFALCDKSFKTAIAIKRHTHTHTGDRPECEKTSSTSRHDGDKPYECPYCPQRFRSKHSMIRHQQIHKGVKREACDICGKNMRMGHLNKHKLLHTGEKPHKCEICEKRFIRIQQLRDHMRTHTGEKPFKCKYCERTFVARTSLVNCLSSHLGDNVFRCEFCPLAFPLASELRSHFTTHKHEDSETRERNMKALREEESKLRLEICNKKTEQPISKEETQQTSEKKLQQQLEIKSSEYAGDKPYECLYCPLRFRWSRSRRRHHKSHEGVKREACDICGKIMSKTGLKYHKKIHTGEKPHKCDFCDKRFFSLSEKRSHMRTHTGEKPFKCKYCERAFAQRSVMMRHLRNHLGDNVFRCDFCPLAFRLASELRSHFTKHKNEDSETRERNMKAMREQEAKLELKFMKHKTQGQSIEEPGKSEAHRRKISNIGKRRNVANR